MTVQFPADAAPFIATSQDILLDEGIVMSTGSDFAEYREIVETERSIQKLGRPFDPDVNDLNERTAFWMIARNAEGDLIHTQAARYINLGQRSLAGFLMRGFRAFPPPLPGVNESLSRFRATPGSHRIQGCAGYHGEFWIAPDRGSYRGAGLAPVFGRTCMLEMIRRWDPDWVFGFILNRVAFKGFGARIGYLHLEPSVLKWVVEGRDAPIDTFLAYNSREDLEYLLDIPLDDVMAMAA